MVCKPVAIVPRLKGFQGVSVFLAPVVHTLTEHGLPSVLEIVLPNAPLDFVSFSSWESLSQPDPVHL